jgi:hypothetical protein
MFVSSSIFPENVIVLEEKYGHLITTSGREDLHET